MRRMHNTTSGLALEDESAIPSGLPVPIAEGGTGAGDPAGARANLDVSATGADPTYLTKAANLSDLTNAATARTNLSLGNVENKSSATIRSEITAANVTTALTYTPLNPANNLSDVASVATARANLGVSAAGTDPAYLTKANNLSDLTNAATARGNLGLSNVENKSSATIRGELTSANITTALTYTPLNRASNLSDVASVATARSNLGVSASGADPAYLTKANNLLDLTNVGTALVNLGLKNGAGAVTLTTTVAQPILLSVNNAERARLLDSGYFKASSNGDYFYPSQPIHTLTTHDSTGYEVLQLTHLNANAYGMMIRFTGGNPNDTTHTFVRCYADGSGDMIRLMSNGGIANFAGNNVNYSDAAIKTDITPYNDADLDALETSFKAVDWCRFKYAGQSHDDWNHGYTAQSIEAAFAGVAPELIDAIDMSLRDAVRAPSIKSVYAADLSHIAFALLARALKRIEELERRLAG